MGMHFYMVQELFTEISALVERYDVNLVNNYAGQQSPPLIVCGVVWNFSRALVTFTEVNHLLLTLPLPAVALAVLIVPSSQPPAPIPHPFGCFPSLVSICLVGVAHRVVMVTF